MNYRSIFISDLHLGLLESQSANLINFLNENSGSLYVIGDLFDILAMQTLWHWEDDNSELIKLFISRNAVYLPGNHDVELDAFFQTQTDYVSGSKKYLLCHGHQVDPIVMARGVRWGVLFCNIISLLNPIIRRLIKRKKWSLSEKIQEAIRGPSYLKWFKNEITLHAKKQGYDGVICGHTHVPEISSANGVDYFNSGYNVDEVQVLVETLDGKFISPMDSHFSALKPRR